MTAPTPPADVLVMLSTAQQIANYKVYKHYGCPKLVLALSSPGAVKGRWNHGMRELVEQRGGVFHELKHSETLRVDALEAVFDRGITPHLPAATTHATIVWNWTGAQKPHSAALYQLARRTAQADQAKGGARRHDIVYADRVELIIEGRERTETLDRALEAEEVLRVHNLRVKVVPITHSADPGTLLSDFLEAGPIRQRSWRRPGYLARLQDFAERLENDEPVGLDELYKAFSRECDTRVVEDFVRHYTEKHQKPEDTDYLDDPLNQAAQSPVHKVWLYQSLNAAKCRAPLVEAAAVEDPAVPSIASGTLFERVAEERLRAWHEADGKDWISDIKFNVDVFPALDDGDTAKIGQFDCLLVAKTGAFYAIDFKSANKRKDYARQQVTAQRGGGAFTSFYYLYPWLDCDVEKAGNDDWVARPTLPPHERSRIAGIIDMDKQLGGRGIRFRTRDGDFHAELRTKLGLGR